MTSIPNLSALVATFALSTPILAAETTLETCPGLAWVTVGDERVQMPVDVADRISMLQKYGTRYARVIDLVIEENMRPDWLFTEDCGAESRVLVASGD